MVSSGFKRTSRRSRYYILDLYLYIIVVFMYTAHSTQTTRTPLLSRAHPRCCPPRTPAVVPCAPPLLPRAPPLLSSAPPLLSSARHHTAVLRAPPHSSSTWDSSSGGLQDSSSSSSCCFCCPARHCCCCSTHCSCCCHVAVGCRRPCCRGRRLSLSLLLLQSSIVAVVDCRGRRCRGRCGHVVAVVVAELSRPSLLRSSAVSSRSSWPCCHGCRGHRCRSRGRANGNGQEIKTKWSSPLEYQGYTHRARKTFRVVKWPKECKNYLHCGYTMVERLRPSLLQSSRPCYHGVTAVIAAVIVASSSQSS